MSGMYDPDSQWRNSYVQAANNDCAYNDRMCINPVEEVITHTFFEFSFPIGDNTISSLHTSSKSIYFLYVYFSVSIVDQSGKTSLSRMFTQAKIDDASVQRACQSFEGQVSMMDATTVDLAIGFVGKEADWATSVRQFEDVTQRTYKGVLVDSTDSNDGQYSSGASSISSALITLSVRGDGEIFDNTEGSPGYFIELETLISIHFLDDTKFRAVMGLIEQQQAYSLIVGRNGIDEIVIDQRVQDLCASTTGTMDCAIRYDITGGVVRTPYGVQPLSAGFNVSDREGARDWIITHLAGNSEFGRDMAENFTALLRDRYDLDDMTRRAWLINPGYKWTAQGRPQSVLELSSNTIMIAVLALREAAGSVSKRRLLTLGRRDILGSPQLDTDTKGAWDYLKQSRRAGDIPPIRNVVYQEEAMQRLYAIDPMVPHRLMSVVAAGRFATGVSHDFVCGELSRRMRDNTQRFSPTTIELHFPSCSVWEAETPARRRLLQEGSTIFHIGLSVLMTFNSTDIDISSRELYRSVLNREYSTSGPVIYNLSDVSQALGQDQFIPLFLAPSRSTRQAGNTNISYLEPVAGINIYEDQETLPPNNTTTYTTPAAGEGVDPGEGVNSGVVIGIVIGLLFLVGIAVLFMWRRHKKGRQTNAPSNRLPQESQLWIVREWKAE